MVAETCSGNWMKDAMVCSSKCRFVRFFRKDFSCLKKIFSPTIFPILGICQYAYQYLVYAYYIYLGIHARSLKCFNNLNLWIIALNPPTCSLCSVHCNLKNKKICIVFTKSTGTVLCYPSQPYLNISIKVLLAW